MKPVAHRHYSRGGLSWQPDHRHLPQSRNEYRISPSNRNPRDPFLKSIWVFQFDSFCIWGCNVYLDSILALCANLTSIAYFCPYTDDPQNVRICTLDYATWQLDIWNQCLRMIFYCSVSMPSQLLSLWAFEEGITAGFYLFVRFDGGPSIRLLAPTQVYLTMN